MLGLEVFDLHIVCIKTWNKYLQISDWPFAAGSQVIFFLPLDSIIFEKTFYLA